MSKHHHVAVLAGDGIGPEVMKEAVRAVDAAADRCACRLGQYGMLPHDLLADLGALFAEHDR